MADALRLFGLRAIVTGADSGIGEAIARTLAKHGAEVLAVDTRQSGIETRFNSVRGIRGATLDVLGADGIVKLTELAATELGVVDIIVCNISPHADAPINDDNNAALEPLLQKKHDRVSQISEQMLPMMKNSPAGRIIIIGFDRSVFGRDGSASYAKSQEKIAALTGRLAAEAGQFGINVNYIQPGSVMTPESRKVFKGDKDLRDFCINRSAAKRVGEPVDIAKVALFLATDDSVFVSGTGIVVDGGRANPD